MDSTHNRAETTGTTELGVSSSSPLMTNICLASTEIEMQRAWSNDTAADAQKHDVCTHVHQSIIVLTIAVQGWIPGGNSYITWPN